MEFLSRFVQTLGQFFYKLASSFTAFWQRWADGMTPEALWADFKADTQAGYKFYSRDVDWESFENQKKSRRRLSAFRALSWALLRKLSPARRIFLLLIMVFVVITLFNDNDRNGANIVIITLGLLLLIALELADRVTMKRDLEIARDIQRWLVPNAPPAVDGIDIAFATRPANTVSGDYYDAFSRDHPAGAGRLLLIVADVAGKSIPAALLMATIQASLRSLASSPVSLHELVLGINRYACANSLAGTRYTTAFIAEWDAAGRTLTYINAGHNAPMVKRKSGAVERLEAGGLPLGIMAGGRYELGHVELDSGDLLVVFTDGVVEAENENEAEFGEPRLLTSVNAMRPATAQDALAVIFSAVDAFVGRTRQHDDITALLLLVR
jgi:serine phosphatase RsbU (regulator of sigma subunit)